jgi:crotonobetainyl-CoA:carnitine CoA-transferase CaiB-like acyl-CoA transferase
MNGFLNNVKIIDASRVFAGPFTTMILSDLGAEVIKIENPEGGDETRYYQPLINKMSSYFVSINRNKSSICLNLKKEEDKKKLFELLKDAEVFIHNFKNSTINSLGIGFDKLKEINNKIIYVTISTYGDNTSRFEEPGYDIVMQGETGLLSVTGTSKDEFCRVGNSTVDVYTGYMAAIMIASALFKKSIDPTFNGVHINVPLFNTGIYSMTYLFGYYTALGKDPQPSGVTHPGIVPYQKFDTEDEPIIIAIANENLWNNFCRAIQRKDLLTNMKFKDNEQRVKNRNILIPILQDILIKKRSSEWLKILKENGIPASKINKISDIVHSDFVNSFGGLFEKEIDGKKFYFPVFPATVNKEYLNFYRKDPPILCAKK